MPTKPKLNQPETPVNQQMRDLFQTPRYGTELILPFIPHDVKSIWECCAGKCRMSSVLLKAGYDVLFTDIEYDPLFNCLTYAPDDLKCSITNVPFSLKRKITYRFIELRKPFAFLMPADYSSWIIDVIKNYGCEKVIPTRRIDYITPNILDRIHQGEIIELFYEVNDDGFSREDKLKWDDIPRPFKDQNAYLYVYQAIDDAPNDLLAKYSCSQFHSMWLTYKFGIGKTETFVELTNEMKRNVK